MLKIKDIYYKNEEIINYVVVGGLTTLVSLIVFYACVWSFLEGNDAIQLQIANVLSWGAGVAFAYITNRVFVFKSKNVELLKEAILFVGSRLITLLIDMGIMFIFSTVLGGNYNLTKLISTILVTVGNYVISKVIVFKV